MKPSNTLLDRMFVVLSFVFLLSIVLASCMILIINDKVDKIDNQTMQIIILLVALMFAVVIYNLVINCITIIGWFIKKQHVREYQKTNDKDIFYCHVKQEKFLCDEKFQFCPICGMKINEVTANE